MMCFVRVFLHFGTHKCLIYPTLNKRQVFLNQPNGLEQPKKIEVFTLHPKNCTLIFGIIRIFLNKLEKKVMS